MSSGACVLVHVDAADGGLSTLSFELMGAGRRVGAALGLPLVALLTGSAAITGFADAAAAGADRVVFAPDATLDEFVGDRLVQVLEQATRQTRATLVLIGHTLNGRELAPRLAFRLKAGLTTDCTELRVQDSQVVMVKPVFGGNAIAEYVANTSIQVATLRPRAFAPTERQEGREVPAEELSWRLDEAKVKTRLIDTVRAVSSEGPKLRDAKIVVSGGRGLGGPENWHYIEELASVLGAAVGATRAVTDAGWVPASLQVGLTGVTVSPDLYVAVGISGAVQHIAGITGARNVVAINRDADANIFRHARFGVVGDYKQILPPLIARLRELRQA